MDTTLPSLPQSSKEIFYKILDGILLILPIKQRSLKVDLSHLSTIKLWSKN